MYLNYLQLRQLKPYVMIFFFILISFLVFCTFQQYIIKLSDSYLIPALLLSCATITDSDSAQYMLSALVQSEAAIIAVVVTLSLVAVQLAASSYSPKIIKIFISNYNIWFILTIYSISIIYGLAVLRLVDSENINISNIEWSISVAFSLGIYNLAVLFPYIKNILYLIDPSKIIDIMSEEITESNVFSIKYPGDNNDRLQDIIYIIISSLMRYDVPTIDYGLNAIEYRIKHIFSNYNPTKDEEERFARIIFDHLYNVAELAINRHDVSAALVITLCIERIGLYSLSIKRKDLLFMAIDSLENVGLLAVSKELSNTTSISSAALKDIAKNASDEGLYYYAYLASEGIGNIEQTARKGGLSSAVGTIVDNLGEVGSHVIQDLKMVDDNGYSPQKIADSIINILGKSSIRMSIETDMLVMDSLGSIGVKATRKIKEETDVIEQKIAQDLALRTISTLEISGLRLLKERRDNGARQAGINLGNIGLEAVKDELKDVAMKSVDSLAKIGTAARNPDLKDIAFVVAMKIREIGVKVAMDGQFDDVRQKAIFYLDQMKKSADESSLSELSSFCATSIDNIKNSKNGKMYRFEQEI